MSDLGNGTPAGVAPARAGISAYTPLVVLVIVLLGVIAVVPSKADQEQVSTDVAVSPTGDGPLADTYGTGATGPVAGSAGAAAPGLPAAGAAAGSTRASGPGATTPGAAGVAAGAGGVAGATASGQQLDAMGRPLTGDKSMCAPGGLYQETVTYTLAPCMPKFEGDNGGATYQGVTKDEIRVVSFWPYSSREQQQALAASGLSVTPEGIRYVQGLYEKFFNKYFDLYGRKLKLITVIQDQPCPSDQAAAVTCFRNEARKINEQHKPFYAYWVTGRWEFCDEMARMKVPCSSAWGPTSVYRNNVPYMWAFYPTSDTKVVEAADHYCKRAYGKTAAYAGTPDLTAKIRKLAIWGPDKNQEFAEGGPMLQARMGGEWCGSATDKPSIYTFDTSDAQKAQDSMAAGIVRMREEGITTVMHWNSATVITGTRAMDSQSYYPEHVFIGDHTAEHDLIGKLASQGQWNHSFGTGLIPLMVEKSQNEDRRAQRDVGKENTECYVCQGWFWYNREAVLLFRYAGPNLTPANIMRGAYTMPQIMGYEYGGGEPWPGWKEGCCSPIAYSFRYRPGSFDPYFEARHIYWSSTAPSPIDGTPGTYLCLEDCRRWTFRSNYSGEPRPLLQEG